MNKKKEITNEKLALMIGRGFEQMDKRFNQIDKWFDRIENQLVSLEIGTR